MSALIFVFKYILYLFLDIKISLKNISLYNLRHSQTFYFEIESFSLMVKLIYFYFY